MRDYCDFKNLHKHGICECDRVCVCKCNILKIVGEYFDVVVPRRNLKKFKLTFVVSFYKNLHQMVLN